MFMRNGISAGIEMRSLFKGGIDSDQQKQKHHFDKKKTFKFNYRPVNDEIPHNWVSIQNLKKTLCTWPARSRVEKSKHRY